MLSVKYTAEQIAEMTKSKEINLITVDSKIYESTKDVPTDAKVGTLVLVRHIFGEGDNTYNTYDMYVRATETE